MKKYLVSCAATLLLTAATSALAATDLSGTYDCKGHAPGGKEYTDGVLNISKSGDLYKFKWEFAKEKSHTMGAGVYNPEDDSTVAVLFTIEAPKPKQSGVIIYKTTDDGIKGTAILQGKELVGGETCTKKK